MSQIGKVLSLLRINRRAGVTPLDFPKGFRLSGYIFLLRKRGYDIVTQDSGIGEMARYVLLKEPKRDKVYGALRK